MDEFGTCDLPLPNMGQSQCFLGLPWEEQSNGLWYSFFYSPEFIYFHSVLLILTAVNVVYFLLTIYCLVRHWKYSDSIIKTAFQRKFTIFIKLFFITGIYTFQCFMIISFFSLGIPWLGEFISHQITFIYDAELSFWCRLFLDFLNLFTVECTF